MGALPAPGCTCTPAQHKQHSWHLQLQQQQQQQQQQQIGSSNHYNNNTTTTSKVSISCILLVFLAFFEEFIAYLKCFCSFHNVFLLVLLILSFSEISSYKEKSTFAGFANSQSVFLTVWSNWQWYMMSKRAIRKSPAWPPKIHYKIRFSWFFRKIVKKCFKKINQKIKKWRFWYPTVSFY